jgi:L-lysine exporter family protein LysE/ArgO
MSTLFFTGFFAGAALIIAIGAQNAFVLRLGLKREHVLPVVALCAGADALLIFAGIAGLGVAIERFPLLLTIARYGGGLFLLAYALMAARRALHPGTLSVADEPPMPLRTALLTALGFTLLNPHVYLDTVILLGSLANQHGDARWQFGAGAITASFVWFSALGYGARLLAPLFRQPRAWRILDAFIALTMGALALSLLIG